MQNVNKSELFSRTEALLGKAALERLAATRVAIFGVGGVGGYVLEALVRSGVGEIDVIDSDTVSVSNINRQILATVDTVGRPKAVVAAERARLINPDVIITPIMKFYTPENADEIPLQGYDYVVDAIDFVPGKIELAVRATALGVPIISSMGTGNKLDPTAFEVSDIKKTSVCPLARAMRTALKRRGIEHLKVVYSKESPVTVFASDEPQSADATAAVGAPAKRPPASCSFVPSVAGLIIASEVIKDLIK